MPVPKRKRSRARRDKRFANKGFKVQAIVECSNCKKPLQTHQACPACGFYKGKKVVSGKLDRMIRRAKIRQSLQEKQTLRATAPEKSE